MDISAFVESLQLVLEPSRLLWLAVGSLMGLVVGLLPGIGGIVGMATLLPFVYMLDPYSAMAMLIGVAAVVPTADTFASVLIGTPGSAGSQATVLDGFALAKKGEAARALSAAFAASFFGGIIGAAFLFFILPVARPLVLALGSPELFMLGMLGLTLVGSLSKIGGKSKSITMGLAAAAFGLLLGTVGGAPAVPEYRYTFGEVYLFEGIPLILLTLGLFALPEIGALIAKGGSIAKPTAEKIRGGWMQGIRDVLTNWVMVLRHSAIGTFIGFTPGLGSAVVDWINYGIAARITKNNHFGQGDIRGVIAPESANNAKEGGALIPTLLFGIPGSASMALLLGALTTLNVQPGPRLLTDNPEVIYTIIWSLVLGTTVGVIICMVLARPLAAATMVPFRLLAPFILLAVAFGAISAHYDAKDYLMLLAFGLLGWFMKRGGIPRAPMLVGFVLSPLLESYLWISVTRYDAGWLLHPGVMIIGALIILFLGWQTLGDRISNRRNRGRASAERLEAKSVREGGND